MWGYHHMRISSQTGRDPSAAVRSSLLISSSHQHRQHHLFLIHCQHQQQWLRSSSSGCSHLELSAVESILFLLEMLCNVTPPETDCCPYHLRSSNPDNKSWTLHPVTLLPALPRVVRAWHQPIRGQGWVKVTNERPGNCEAVGRGCNKAIVNPGKYENWPISRHRPQEVKWAGSCQLGILQPPTAVNLTRQDLSWKSLTCCHV